MRRPLDFYPTPSWATRELLRRLTITGSVLEPCAGDGAIAAVLLDAGLDVETNDIDPSKPTETHSDATCARYWDPHCPDWVITNPPFSHAGVIVPHARRAASVGVAMLLRLSFLEPTAARVDFLEQHPPTDVIVLPRISFTGDGKTDSVTCAWMVWDKYADDGPWRQAVQIARRAA